MIDGRNLLAMTAGLGTRLCPTTSRCAPLYHLADNPSQYSQTSRLVPPADHHDTSGEVNPADHGFGPVEISVFGFPTEIDDRVIGTAKIPGSEFPFNVDISSGKPVGVGQRQTHILSLPLFY